MVTAEHSNIGRGPTPRLPYPHSMSSRAMHYPASYSEPVSYPAMAHYNDLIYPSERDTDVYAPQLWHSDPRKLQAPVPNQQHLPSHQSQPQQPQLSIQTHFSEVKPLPFYAAHHPSPPSTASSYSDGVYPQQVTSEEWSHPHARNAYTYMQHEMHVKQEDAHQVYAVENYSQPAVSFEGVPAGYYSAYAVSHPDLSSSDASSAGSPHLSGSFDQSPQLACDPRYVSQERVVEPSSSNRASQDGHSDMDGESELENYRSAARSPASASSSSASSDLGEEDDEYDPRDPDYSYRARRRLSVPNAHNVSDGHRSLRPRAATMRYSPYDTSYEVDYLQAHPRRTPSSVSDTSSLSSPSNTPATPTSPLDPNARLRGSAGLPLPVPVPNLTKKSRGRRVPTVHHLEIGKGPVDASRGLDNGEFGDQGNPISSIGNTAGLTGGRRGAAKGLRMFTCKVPGCGKCFARGEHLKRHVRSIHTYEKPHKCPHPGCGKDFSRHDNLNQHMRVHRKDKSR